MRISIVLICVCCINFIFIVSCENDLKCGVIDESPQFIVKDETDGTWPWMASLGFFDDEEKWKHQCGTTLISRNFFLTAAHCVQILTPKWQILGGIDDLKIADSRKSTFITIRQKIIHNQFDGSTAYFDIALLRTDEVQFTQRILPICLPHSPSNDLNKYDNHLMDLIGWGSASLTQATSSALKRVVVKKFTQRYCNSTHYSGLLNPIYKNKVELSVPNLFQSSVMCAGLSNGQHGSCKGDSGGPLFSQDDETRQYTQIGVVHGGIAECGSSTFPGIYVRLDDPMIFEFIQSNINAQELGHRIFTPETPITTAEDGHWGPWSSYSSCSVTCGRGQQTKTRECNSPAPENGGNYCVGDNSQSTTCSQISCTEIIDDYFGPQDGRWGPWSSYSSCSVSCGKGQHTRSRQCNNPAPENGGKYCVGEDIHSSPCSQRSCRVPQTRTTKLPKRTGVTKSSFHKVFSIISPQIPIEPETSLLRASTGGSVCCETIYLFATGAIGEFQSAVLGLYTRSQMFNGRPYYVKNNKQSNYYFYYRSKDDNLGSPGWIIGHDVGGSSVNVVVREVSDYCPVGIRGGYDRDQSYDNSFTVECEDQPSTQASCCSQLIVSAERAILKTQSARLGKFKQMGFHNGHPLYHLYQFNYNSYLFFRKKGIASDGWTISDDYREDTFSITTRERTRCPDNVTQGFDRNMFQDQTFSITCDYS